MMPASSRLGASLLVAAASLIGACAVDRAGLATVTGQGGQVASDGGAGAGGAGGAVVNDSGAGTGGAGGAGSAGGTGGSTVCDSSTCRNGCCVGGDTCVTNRDDQQCGNGGAACAPCDSCYRCGNAGACEMDPGSAWEIICASATVAATKPANMPWDPTTTGVLPAPDPFCQLTINGVSAARTLTILNTLTPTWNASITPADRDLTADLLVSQAGSWAVAVFDDDGTQTVFEPICSVSPLLTPADFAAGSVTFSPTQSCLSLTIKLNCAQ